MTEVAVGQDQTQGKVQKEIGLDASDVKNMIICKGLCKHRSRRKKSSTTKCNK